jgi:fatty-acyl-CoA synthase
MNLASPLTSESAPGERGASRSAARAWVRALEATAGLDEHSLLTLARGIDDVAERSPDALALVSSKGCLTYRQLVEMSHRYARWALAEDVGFGDVVGLLMRNRPEYLAIWLGITRVGGVVALLNPNLTGAALAHCINIVAPRHVIAEAGDSALDRSWEAQLVRPCRIWRFGADVAASEPIDETVKRFAGSRLSSAESRDVTLSHKALQIYTSGTTGRPKAANVSHHRVMMWSRWFAGMMNVSPDDRMYDCLPMYHSIGGIVATGALLVSGGSVVLREKFSAKSFWQDVSETGCTLFQYIGELCRYLANEPQSAFERNHRLRLCCGNGLRADVWETFKQRFEIPEILEFYAATEGNFSLYNVEGRVGAIGRVPPFLAHRFPVALVVHDPVEGSPVRDGLGRCIRADVDQAGEAIGKIGSDAAGFSGRFEGYSSDTETNGKILRDVFAPGDAWYRTGDLMRRDKAGFFHFVDRIGDTFRWKGENVATLEVEEIVLACAGVRDAIVYGVKAPRCEGRAGMVALVTNERFDPDVFWRHCEAALPDYARPRFVRIRAAAEVTETFKHKKNILVEEGYDPKCVKDALYFSDRARKAYVPLNSLLFEHIMSGQARL